MSRQSVDVVRAFYDRWDAADLAPAFELIAPDVEWHTAPSSLSAGKTLGVQAVLRHMDQLLDAEVIEESDVTVDGRIVDVRGFMTHEEAPRSRRAARVGTSGRPDRRGLRRNPGATGPRMSW